MLSLSEQDRLVKVIRNAYRDYPKTDETVDEMIKQALRSAFVRGQNSRVGE